MSPNEYKAMVNDFTEALKKRCAEEGISCETNELFKGLLGLGPDTTLYILNSEGYALTNDGNHCNWQFIGNIKAS